MRSDGGGTKKKTLNECVRVRKRWFPCKCAHGSTSVNTHTHTHCLWIPSLDGRLSPVSSPEERRRGKGERDWGERYAEVACLPSAYHLLPLLHARCTLATRRERNERGSPRVEESEPASQPAVEPTLLVCSVNINCIFCSSTPPPLILLFLSPPPTVFFILYFSLWSERGSNFITLGQPIH